MVDENLLRLLESKIATIKNKVEQRSAHGLPTSEADTERIVIEPLLEVLGYDDWQIIQQGRDADTKGIPDYTIIYGSDNKWMLEAKSMTHSLNIGDAQQVVNYANNLGAEWAVLSNGRSWHIYNAHLAKPLNQKLMFQISDLFTQTNAVEILCLLSRESMQNNHLLEAWTEKRFTAIVTEQLRTQDSETRRLLRRLVSEQTNVPVSEKSLGSILEAVLHSPDVAPVAAPILVIKVEPKTNEVTDIGGVNAKAEDHTTEPAVAISQLLRQPDKTKQYTLAQLSENTALASGLKPVSVCFNGGDCFPTRHWADVAVRLIEWLHTNHDFDQIPFLAGEDGKQYLINDFPVHLNGEQMRSPKSVYLSSRQVYVNTHGDTVRKIHNFVMLLKTTGVDPGTVTIKVV